MNLLLKLVGLVVLSSHIGLVAADPQPAPSADGLQESLRTLAQHHQELEDLLGRQIIHADLADVHHLTYGIRDALTDIKARIEALESELDEVRVAAERGEQVETKEQGQQFLQFSRPLVD